MDRADFYTGSGLNAFYIGSLSRYGDPISVPADILIQTNWRMYEHMVEEHIQNSKYGHLGMWIWPWPHSGSTDYAYFFINGKVFCTMQGGSFFDPIKIKQGEDMKKSIIPGTIPEFPLIGGKHSGSTFTKVV